MVRDEQDKQESRLMRRHAKSRLSTKNTVKQALKSKNNF